MLANTVAGSPGRRKTQTIACFAQYLTASDMEVLAGGAMLHTKIEVLARRCVRVGLTCPSEPSVRAIIAAGVAAGISNLGTPQQKYSAVVEFKRQVKDLDKKETKAAVHLLQLPADPKHLPESLFQRAYSADDPPTGLKSEDEVLRAAAGIKVRKSAKELRANSFVNSPSSSSQMAAGACQQWGMIPWLAGQGQSQQQIMTTMMQMMQSWHQHQQQQEQPGELKLQFFNPNNKQAASSSQHANSPEALGRLALPCSGNPGNPATTAAADAAKSAQPPEKEPLPLETQIVNDALPDAEILLGAMDKKKATNKAMKKPSCAKAAAKAAVMKRPAAAAGCSAGPPGKRPPVPEQGAGTTWYNGGKIHRSDRSACWRVFVCSSDRVDRKVNWKGDLKGSWSRALDVIDAGK